MGDLSKDKNGYIRNSDSRDRDSYVHVKVAQEKLGRKLGKKEIPHHLDENKENNSPDNILVLRSESDHRVIHSKIPHEIFKTKDGSHVVIKDQKKCPYCQGLFEPKKFDDVYCDIKCHLADKASGIPSAKELKELVWKAPTSKVAKAFNVSDVAVSKWCKKLGIDKPPRGYWQKKAFDNLK